MAPERLAVDKVPIEKVLVPDIKAADKAAEDLILRPVVAATPTTLGACSPLHAPPSHQPSDATLINRACSSVVIALCFGTQGPGFEPSMLHASSWLLNEAKSFFFCDSHKADHVLSWTDAARSEQTSGSKSRANSRPVSSESISELNVL